MSTVAQVIDKTIRQHLEMGGPSQVNRIAASINTSVEALVLDWEPEPNLAPGTFIEIDSEVMMVVQAQDTYVDVLRAQWGTTAASHTQAALIRVQPRFLRSQVHTEIQDEIRSWPSTLFGVTTVDVTWASDTYDVDLTGALNKEVTRLLEVRLEPTQDEPWGDLFSAVSVHRAATADFTSGWRLHSLRAAAAATVRVTYAHEFTLSALATESTDLITTAGLSLTMEDIIRYGAAARLMMSQEAERARIDVQGTTRFAEEVPPQHQLTAAEALMKLRDKRLQDEEERLISRWGV